jgi:hypothetical protein
MVLTGNFNIPNVDCINSLSMNNCQYYINRKETQSMLPLACLDIVTVIRLKLVEICLI